MREQVQALFFGGYCDDQNTAATIRQLWEEEGYLCDTHTAVAVNVYRQYLQEENVQPVPTVIASTANPYKFSASVLEALGKPAVEEDFANLPGPGRAHWGEAPCPAFSTAG